MVGGQLPGGVLVQRRGYLVDGEKGGCSVVDSGGRREPSDDR